MDCIVTKIDIENDYINHYFTKDFKPINFDCFYINDKEDSHMSQLIIQASVDGEVAGYISLLYLSEENKNKYFSTALDYYFNKKMSKKIFELYNDNFEQFCINFNNIYDSKINNKNDFIEYVEKEISNDYKKFISFYLNKPYTEIVTVYNEDDYKSKDFSEFPFLTIKRNNINFSGKGIATALYHCACKILKKDNLNLYASNNQTKDGQRMWMSFENNPKFLNISDNYYGSLTTDRKGIIEIQRKGITI